VLCWTWGVKDTRRGEVLCGLDWMDWGLGIEDWD